METQARRALVASGNDLDVFVSRPLTVVLLLFAIAALIAPFVLRRRGAPPVSAED
jgi:putative tricarboxylic transport membrane protein